MHNRASMIAQAARAAAGGAALALLAGCSSDLVSFGGGSPAPPARSEPPPDMAGRWMLSSAAGGACGMNLGGVPGASEGTIRPEGGCPGNFFTSRKWTYENGGLIIRNHNSEPLAQLTAAAPGRFDGQATGGQPVSLAR